MITPLFRGHPEQYLHALPRTCHTQLLRRGLGFGGVGEPPPLAGIFVFDKMLRFKFCEC